MLKKLAKRIQKELDQACDYAEQAMLVKNKSSQTAELFATLSEEELVHAEKLLREGHRLVKAKEGGSYDSTKAVKSTEELISEEHCKAIWEWETRLADDAIAECRFKLSMFRRGG